MFKIISDGGCDFAKYEAKRHHVDIVPFYISFDQQNYLKEGADISKEDFFKRLAEEKGLFPKTAQPNPQDYIDAFIPHLKKGEDILVLTISSKLSGSYNSAVLAAQMMKEEYPDRTIVLVDSLNVSIGQGLILREIIKMRDAGLTLAEVARIAEKICATTRVYVTLDTLEYLKRGGRVGPTTAFVGGILKLNPILQLSDGKVTQLDNVRGRKRAIRLIEEAMVDALKDEAENINLSIGHISNEKDAATFKTSSEEALGMKISNPITAIGVTIGSHMGPGALGFAYCKKYEAVLSEELELRRSAA